MRGKLGIPALTICLVLAIVSCGTKKQKERPLAVMGSDTLAFDVVASLVPDSSADSARLTQALIRRSLSRAGVTTPADHDTLAQKLSRKLSLVSGRDWSARSSEVLLAAARVLHRRAQETGNSENLFAFVESLCVANSSVKSIRLSREAAFRVNPDDKRSLSELFKRVFDLSVEEADLVAEFVQPEEHLSSTGETARDMVKGLLSNDKEPQQQKLFAPASRPLLEHDNSLLAMKFRTRESITDSIERHTPDLQAIYKRLLKKHSDMSGNVWVIFRVDASGKVIELRIKSSEIAEPEFLNLFSDYARTIRFKQIPEKVGNMTFEFPFEFKAEM